MSNIKKDYIEKVVGRTFDTISNKINNISESIESKNYNECKEFININKDKFKELIDKSDIQNIEYALLFKENNYESQKCHGEECFIDIPKENYYYAIFHTHPLIQDWRYSLLSVHDIAFGANKTNIIAVGSKEKYLSRNIYEIKAYKISKDGFDKEKQYLIDSEINLRRADLLLAKAIETENRNIIKEYIYNLQRIRKIYTNDIIEFTNKYKCYTFSELI